MSRDDLDFSDVSQDTRDKYASPPREYLQKFKSLQLEDSTEDQTKILHKHYKFPHQKI